MTGIREKSSLLATIFLLFFLISSDLFAQVDLGAFEIKTLALFTQLNGGEKSADIDSVIEENFMTILSELASFTYPFTSLQKYLTVATSADQKLRFICWNTTLGGTMENVAAYAQYIGSDGKLHVCNAKMSHEDIEPDQAVYYDQVFKFDSCHYLVFGHGKYSTQDRAYSVSNFKIDANSLTDTNRIFYTDTVAESVVYNEYTIFKNINPQ